MCGKQSTISAVPPTKDAICPHCGSLIWPDDSSFTSGDSLRRLAELGAFAETDDEDQVRKIRFVGEIYDDSTVDRIAEIEGVEMMDIVKTAITRAGVERLRQLLPDTLIKSRWTQ
ncbi:MAG: hypothetical protein CMJ48_11485 [Planctomycetaceae bacterium]|nr:hypothetical protein [Planctomycetaceae bacterium]